MPTISTSSPTLTMPVSTRPVTTVPRPEIENTSSIGIRNGRSSGRSGCGIHSSTAAPTFRIAACPRSGGAPRGAARPGRLAPGRGSGGAGDDGDVVAVKVVLREKLADLKLDELEDFRVVDE